MSDEHKTDAEIMTELKDLATRLSFAVEDFTVHTDAFGREHVSFTTLHVPLAGGDGATMHACGWKMPPEQALRYLTGFADGAGYFLQLDKMGRDRRRNGL